MNTVPLHIAAGFNVLVRTGLGFIVIGNAEDDEPNPHALFPATLKFPDISFAPIAIVIVLVAVIIVLPLGKVQTYVVAFGIGEAVYTRLVAPAQTV